MGDYLCRYCYDLGNCTSCSPSFESNRMHTCGWPWGEHRPRNRRNIRPEIFMTGDCPPRRRPVPNILIVEWP